MKRGGIEKAGRVCRVLSLPLLGVSAVFVAIVIYWNFLVVPPEKVMGDIQRIFYFHVAGAISTYLFAGIILICGLLFLMTEEEAFDAFHQSASELGFVFSSATLFTGMIWADTAWNTPFRFEPRLVSFLLLWLMFLALIFVRAFGDKESAAKGCAVLGILAAMGVPLAVFSIKFLPEGLQLHPVVVEKGGLKDVRFNILLYMAMISVVFLSFALFVYSTRVIIAQRRENG